MTAGRPHPPSAIRPSWQIWALVAGIALMLWVALAAWAMSSPVGASPDDDFHIAGIYCAAGEADCTSSGLREKPCFAAQPYVSGDCQRDGLETQPRTEGMVAGYYPPLYNTLMSSFVGPTVADTVRSVRLANVTLTVALVLASILLTRRALRVAVATGWLVFAVPLTVFITSSINPNAWSILGISALWGPALSFITERGGRRLDAARVAFVAVAALMALGSRSETPLFVGLIAGALFLAGAPWPVRHLERYPRLLLPVSLGLASLVSLVLFGSEKTDHIISGDYDRVLNFTSVLFQTFTSPLAGLGVPGIPANMLGWSDTIMPVVVSITGVTALLLAVSAGLRVMDHRKLVVIACFAIPALLLILYFWTTARHNTRFPPRYFMPVFIAALGLIMLPKFAAISPIPGRRVLPSIAILVSIGNAFALMTNTVRYTVGITDDVKASPGVLRDGGEPWWWWDLFGLPPYAQWLLGLSAFATASVVGAILLLAETPPRVAQPYLTGPPPPSSIAAVRPHPRSVHLRGLDDRAGASVPAGPTHPSPSQ